MTVNYCDFVNGDDDTGDGTAENPYKTIDMASSGLAGGDEMRCAKSPAPTNLSGTLTWVNGSNSVATSQDLTGVLVAKDFIRKTTLQSSDYDIWWEIQSITSTTITLVKTFRGYASESVASQKLGTTDTGAATSGEDVQGLAAEGDDQANQLVVSGGWNLNTEEQDGETWFRQTGSSRLGNGLQSYDWNFVHVEKCHFLRYNNGIYLNDSYEWNIEYCQLLGSGTLALQANAAFDIGFSHITTNGEIRLGYDSLPGLQADNLLCLDGVVQSFGLLRNAVLKNSTLNLAAGSITRNLSGSSITLNAKAPCRLYVVSGISSVNVETAALGHSVTMKYIDGASAEKAYQYYGIAQKDIANARSGACIKITPVDIVDPFEQILKLAAVASTQKTVNVYMKKSSDFNGVIQAALMFKGTFLAAFTTWSMTTSYQQFSLTAQAADIDEAGILELWVRVTGTAGSVYIDDLS